MGISCTEHIGGQNQSLETFQEVLKLRAEGFAIWYLSDSQSTATNMDEADWDDAYRHWLENVDQRF